jgi:hypothetical protein
MRASIFPKIPDLDTARLIAADKLALIWVDDHIVYGRIMGIGSLHLGRPARPQRILQVTQISHTWCPTL